MKATLVILTSLLAAALVALVASSTAGARHAPGYAYPTPSTMQTDDLQDARLGPKYVTVSVTDAAAPATPVVRVPAGGGFDWADAMVGAGVAAGAIAVVGVGALVVARRNPHVHIPSHS